MSESGRDEGEYDAEGHDGDIGVSPSPSHRPARRSSFTDTNGMAELRADVGELRHMMTELAAMVHRNHLAVTTQLPARSSPTSSTPRRTGLRTTSTEITSVPMWTPPDAIGEGGKEYHSVIRIEVNAMKQRPFNPDEEGANVVNFHKRLMHVLGALGHQDGHRRPEVVRDEYGGVPNTPSNRALEVNRDAYDRMSYTCLIAIRNSVEEKSSLGRQLALCDDHERALTLVRALLANAEDEAKRATRDFLNLEMASPSQKDVGTYFAELYSLDALAKNDDEINWSDSFLVEHVVRAAEKHKPFRLLGEVYDGLTAEERATSLHFANMGALHRRIMALAKKHDAIEDSVPLLAAQYRRRSMECWTCKSRDHLQRDCPEFKKMTPEQRRLTNQRASSAYMVREQFRAMAATLNDLDMSLAECLETDDDSNEPDLEAMFAQHLGLAG